MKMRYLLIVPLLAFFSCASGPVDIPPETPPNKVIQRAQEAADVNKYKIALQCYEILLERYGSVDEYLAVGEYEIAFIHYKKKRYARARQGFETLLERYAKEGNALPSQFRVLSEKMLSRITELGF